MAEFKLNSALSEALDSVDARSGQLIASEASLPDSSLSTAKRIAEQQREICALLREYQELVKKDTNDLRAMVAHVQKVDNDLANL